MDQTNTNPNGNHEPIRVMNAEQTVPGTTRERIEEAFRVGEILYKYHPYNLFFRQGDFLHHAVDPMQGVFLYHCVPKKE